MTGLQNGRHPARADYDWRGFARLTRRRLADDPRGYRALADIIGVTLADLSRAASGQMLSVQKVMAICDFLGVAERDFYLRPAVGKPRTPAKSNCFSGSNVKHAGRDG